MKKFLLFAVAVLALSCSKDEAGISLANDVAIDPTITRATEVDFESGDVIGLTISTAESLYADNAKMVFNGESFLAEGSLKWYEDMGVESTLTAYYPYSELKPATFSVQADQSGDGYLSSDFMMAKKEGVTPTAQAVNMTFYHKMTKIVINLTNEYKLDIEKVTLCNSLPTVTIDHEAATVAVDAESVAQDITAKEVSKLKYAAIVAPQSVAMKVVVVAGGKEYTKSLVEAELKSGAQYSVSATLVPESLDASISGDIENWEDEGEIEGEDEKPVEVSFEEFDTYFVYDGETYNFKTLKDGNTWMVENLRYLPAGKTATADPTLQTGVWYPAANAEKVGDPALVATLGLLYDAATAFGVDEITAENAASFEGVQGICPKGWHIPTLTEMTGLVGHCSNSAVINTNGAYYDATIKGASIAALAADGFIWSFSSMRNRTSLSGAGSYTVTSYNDIFGVMSYLIGSTNYQVKTDATSGEMTNVQYYYLMPLYNATNEKVSVAYGNFLSGSSLRCVRDTAK